MDPSASPPSFLSPLSSPTPSPPQKPSKSSPTPSSALPSKRQCACPCGPFEAELKAALSLVTFQRYPSPRLVPSPYPSDLMTGKRISVEALRKYSRSHVWPDGIYCFCSLRPGGEAHSVRLFFPSEGSMQGLLCLGCPDWTPDGVRGCRYLVNLKGLFDPSGAPLATEGFSLQDYPLRVRPHTRSSQEHSLTPTSNLLVSSPHLIQPSTSIDQGHIPSAFGVKPGLVTDSKRIWSPPPADFFDRVEEVPIPAAAEVEEVFDEMVNGTGVSYRRLMSVIGKCVTCDQVMTLPNILTHLCIGRNEDSGPSHSKHPLLPENLRASPTIGPRIKEIVIEADHEYVELEFAGEVTSTPKRKRKASFSTPPSQQIAISATKKPRMGSKGSSSPSQREACSSVRIPTPESSRQVYRDKDEDFIMYEKV